MTVHRRIATASRSPQTPLFPTPQPNSRSKHTKAQSDRAIAALKSYVGDIWYAQAIASIAYLAGTRATFTTDDVWNGLPPSAVPIDRRILGPLMLDACHRRLAGPTKDRIPSSDANRFTRVWRSTQRQASR